MSTNGIAVFTIPTRLPSGPITDAALNGIDACLLVIVREGLQRT